MKTPDTLALGGSRGDIDLHVEPLKPFTWRNTMMCIVLWPLGAVVSTLWLCLFLLLDTTRLLRGRRMFHLPKFAARVTMLIPGIWVTTRRHQQLDTQRAYVLVPNHVSMCDAPVLSIAMPVMARAMQLASHTRIPIYGTFVELFGEILVDYKDAESKRRASVEAHARLGAGESVLVFAEGERSPGGRLGSFFPGAFRLAIEAGVAVVPVAQRGLRNICPPGEWRGRPGRVEVLFGEPIETLGLTADDSDELAHRVRRSINTMLATGELSSAADSDRAACSGVTGVKASSAA